MYDKCPALLCAVLAFNAKGDYLFFEGRTKRGSGTFRIRD